MSSDGAAGLFQNGASLIGRDGMTETCVRKAAAQ
jgi:hypothetical protein